MEGNVIELLRSCPGMFLWGFKRHPFHSLVEFLSGYMLALQDVGANDNLKLDTDFGKWLLGTKKLSGELAMSWPGIIMQSFPDEEARFEAFFGLYDEYIASFKR